MDEVNHCRLSDWSFKGTRFHREEMQGECIIKEEFRVQHVKGYVKWKVSGSGTACLLLKRLSDADPKKYLMNPKRYPILKLAEYPRDAKSNSGEVETMPFEFAFEEKNEDEFWKHGRAGETVF